MPTRRPARAVLTMVAAPLLVLAAVVAVAALRHEANARRADQLAFTRLEVRAQALNGYVLEAAADGRVRPEVAGEVAAADRALDDIAVHELGGNTSAVREVRLGVDVCRTLSSNVLAALHRGHRHQAD